MTPTHGFRQEADALRDEAIRIRRDLHAHPELGFEETRTAGIVASYLSDLGLDVRTGVGKTGVVGLLRGACDGPTVLVRADMDALPIHEQTGAEYASQNAGVMHACGHDGHTTIGLVTAKLLSRRRDALRGIVKFVFQPAEEILAGAKAMIEDGVLAEPPVDVALGLHLWSTRPLGMVATRPGPFMAACDMLHIRVVGKGSHAAMPHRGVDSVVVASQIVTAMQTIVSRGVSPFDSAVVSFGTVHGGTAPNILPAEVALSGTVRTFRDAVRDDVHRRIYDVAEGIANAHGAKAHVSIQRVADPLENDTQMAELVLNTAREMFGDAAILSSNGSMGSEDMSFFLREVPGCFFYLGAQPAQGTTYPHHSPCFDFDEGALPLGAALMAASVFRYLNGSDA